MSHHPPRKPPPPPAVVADTFVADAAADNPEYADTTDPLAAYPSIAIPSDPRDLKVHRDQPPRDVPYLPTDQHIVNKMLEMAKVTKADVLYDLGCGDGRICITAAKLGARAVGVEIDLQRLRECHDNLRNTQLKHLVEFRRQSFFETDLRPCTVLALYLLPAINRLLRPKFLFELRPGSRVVANYFEIAGWTPDEQVTLKHRPVMLWIVPAWVGGTYRCTFELPGTVASPTRRFHADLALQRNIQFLTGHIRFGNRRLAVTGRIRGYDVEVDLPELPKLPGPVRLTAKYEDRAEQNTAAVLRGTFSSPTASGTFGAIRTLAEARV
jgi:SAM-dependent methyltransferase